MNWVNERYVERNHLRLRNHKFYDGATLVPLGVKIPTNLSIVKMYYVKRKQWLSAWCLTNYDTMYYLNGETASCDQVKQTMQKVVQRVANMLFYGTVKITSSVVEGKAVWLFLLTSDYVKWQWIHDNLVTTQKQRVIDNTIYSKQELSTQVLPVCKQLAIVK